MNNVAEDAVKIAIRASAPERAVELSQMWEEHQPNVHQTYDKKGFSLEAGSFGLVLFDHKTMCQIWLLGFAAQHSFNLYLPYLILYQATGISFFPYSMVSEQEEIDIQKEVSALYDAIDMLKEAENVDDVAWPSSIPNPDNGKPSDVNGSMVFDLLCMASAYCFLHELRHVQFRNLGSNIDPIEEEYECDKYARNFLLEKIDEYAMQSGYDLSLLKNKRGMAIALASILLLVVTPESHWQGSASHPSVVSRIQELVDAIGVSDNDYFWPYLSCLLISVIFRKKISINSSIVKNQREYCLFLLGAIETK
ncbi:phage exclusion protein Lit family protein [Janthinobacterium sp. PC23-8]|uniref:phage exclusion protein Lit family protein n=1 Tax=Janthinobacterium sp. PC23-8 TaxID=2012679 RepID=UPI000B975EDA|nr:phage exclusion protein Lit family protein [Janthinobacterium sp. PC23-8]OYO31345.1 hypothetical protein CD932_09595 [Janthinobacterium sp. PC23-8]